MKPRIATLDRIFVQNDLGLYEPYEPDPDCRYPGLVLVGLCIIAWSVIIALGYASYRAALAWMGA